MIPRLALGLAALVLAHAAMAAAETHPRLALRGHYVLDAAHPPAAPTDTAAWLERVVDEALRGDVGAHRDLFAHGGPGPAGLEWNGDADLLLVVVGPASARAPQVSFTLGPRASSIALVRCEQPRCAAFGVVPSAQWIARLRPPRSSDAALGLPSLPDVERAVLRVRATGRWSDRRFALEAAFALARGE